MSDDDDELGVNLVVVVVVVVDVADVCGSSRYPYPAAARADPKVKSDNAMMPDDELTFLRGVTTVGVTKCGAGRPTGADASAVLELLAPGVGGGTTVARAAPLPLLLPSCCCKRASTRGFQNRFRLLTNQLVSCLSSMPVSAIILAFSCSVGYGCATCSGLIIQALRYSTVSSGRLFVLRADEEEEDVEGDLVEEALEGDDDAGEPGNELDRVRVLLLPGKRKASVPKEGGGLLLLLQVVLVIRSI